MEGSSMLFRELGLELLREFGAEPCPIVGELLLEDICAGDEERDDTDDSW